MSIRVAINGLGRIGEMFLRAVLEDRGDIDVVAINDLGSLEQLEYLLKYDSVHRRPTQAVSSGPGWLKIGDEKADIFQVKDPSQLPWGDLKVDMVVESTGVFETREGMSGHLAAGAKRVVLTAPSKNTEKDPQGADITVCMGVNHTAYDPAKHFLISNASCTTNCLAPVLRVLDEAFGVEWGLMSTIHAYTGSQALVDKADKDRRRGRSAALNIVPSSTGAARAIGLVMPQLAGKIDGMSYRVPVPDGSVTDLVFQSKKPLSQDALVAAFTTAAADPSYLGVLAITHDPLVSSDIVGTPYSAIVDAPSLMVMGDHTAKVAAWYDNEWGYACRVRDLVAMIGKSSH